MSWPSTIERVEALALGPARDIGVKTFARFDQRREHLERSALRRRLHLPNDRGETLFFHRQIAVRTKLRSGFGEEEPEEMINFRHGRDGRFAAAAGDALLDRDASAADLRRDRHPVSRVARQTAARRATCCRENGAGLRRKEYRTRRVDLPEPLKPGDDDHLVARNIERDVLEIVLARAVDARWRALVALSRERGDVSRLAPVRRSSSARRVSEGPSSNSAGIAQREKSSASRRRWLASRVRSPEHSRKISARCATPPLARPASGVPARDDFAAFVAAFRPEIDDPVGALDHLEVVLDHDDRIARFDQPLKKPARSIATSSKCSPVVGSSKMKRSAVFPVSGSVRCRSNA